MSKPDGNVAIACFGETLWDILPRGIFLGGAPLNAAYHLSRHGVKVRPVTAVGRDFLGDEAGRRIAGWGVDTRWVARTPDRPTGTVRATLDARGVASYRFASRVAWDAIPTPPALLRQPAPDALVFGTLALRNPSNRRALRRLIDAWPEALRVLDLNLRPPFDRPEAVEPALRQAQLLKLNDSELARLAGSPVKSLKALEPAARRLSRQPGGPQRICVTAGERGAGLLWDGLWFWESARRVEVRDTVGAGDSFLGALLAASLRRGTTPAEALACACRVGEFVAARDGATPPYEIDRQGRPRDVAN